VSALDYFEHVANANKTDEVEDTVQATRGFLKTAEPWPKGVVYYKYDSSVGL